MASVDTLLSDAKKKAEVVSGMRRFEESERHWYCRKSFLTKNWDDFSDENRHRLECHSICWANLHFLGCNYPFTVLAKINEMSYGLPNMSEMLKYADQQVADAACERRMKRRGDFEEKNEKSNTGEINEAKVRRTNEQYPASNLGNRPKIDQKNLPGPLRPSAKQIGLFLTLSSAIKKKKLGLMDAVRVAQTKISFLSEEVGAYNLEAMREFHQRADIIETDEVVEVNLMGVFVAQAVGTRAEARRKAEEEAFFKLQQNCVVVVTAHRQKANGQIISELVVSNTRGSKTLGQVPPKLKAPEIRVEPI